MTVRLQSPWFMQLSGIKPSMLLLTSGSTLHPCVRPLFFSKQPVAQCGLCSAACRCLERALCLQEVWGYQPCLWKRVLVAVGAVCSCGLLLLLLYWLPEWGVKSTCTPAPLKDAHTLLLRTTVGSEPWESQNPAAPVQLLYGDSDPSYVCRCVHVLTCNGGMFSSHSEHSLVTPPLRDEGGAPPRQK